MDPELRGADHGLDVDEAAAVLDLVPQPDVAGLGDVEIGGAAGDDDVRGAGLELVGRGEQEGVSNVKAPSEDAATKSLEVLKQISSTGYLRKRMPQELVVLNGGAATALASDPAAAVEAAVVETAAVSVTTEMSARDKAKMQGYEGEACGECGNYTLVRNGTCMKCNTCGGTSGCS